MWPKPIPVLFALFGLSLASDTPDANLHLNVIVTPDLQAQCQDEISALSQSKMHFLHQMKLAICIHSHGYFQTALEIYSHIERTNLNQAYVLVNKAAALLKLGEIKEARDSMYKYFDQVGGIDMEGAPTDVASLQKGPPCTPHSPLKADCVNACNTIAAIEMSDGKNSTAVRSYLHRAIEIGEEDMLHDVFLNYAGHLATIGDEKGAEEYFVRGFLMHLKRGDLDAATSALVRRAMLIPKVFESAEEVEQTRINFSARISDITELAKTGGITSQMRSDLFNSVSMTDEVAIPKLSNTLRDWTSIQVPHFNHHYLGFHDSIINKEVSDMFSHLCPNELFEISQHLNQTNLQPNRPKKRVGIISSLVGGDEPHGLLVKPVLKDLKNIFDFYIISVGLKSPSQEFYTITDGRVFTTGLDDMEAKRILHSLELDCLIYLEALNTAQLYFLGYQRFSEVQILVMGAPVTSGIGTFDYFLSGDLLEHPFRTQLRADSYTEQVVLFDGQAISFPATQHHLPQDLALAAGDAHTNMTSLERMALLASQDTHLYICFQNIVKIQPVFDHVLIDILLADRKANIILQASRHAAQTKTLTNRLEKTLEERLCGFNVSDQCSTESFQSRIHFLARIPSDEMIEFYQRSGSSSVVLQPFPFDGSKTTSDAINAGIPPVTYPQPNLRGRMTHTLITAVLAADDVPSDVAMCCSANSVSDYVSKALRLTSDHQFRRRVSASIQKHAHRIFSNKSVSLNWAKFMTRALELRMSDHELEYEIGMSEKDKHYRSFSAKALENNQRRWSNSVMLGHRPNI